MHEPISAACDQAPADYFEPCVFDVVAGGLDFEDDQIYQETCGGEGQTDALCSGHGLCVSDECVCNAGTICVRCV